MKKYKIELSEEQMRVIAQCLEDVSRFASGQWKMENTIEAMLQCLPFEEQIKRRDEAEELLKKVKRILLPELQDNASKGYNGSEFIGNTYQIYRTILHQFAIDNNWNNVYSYSALPSGNLGTIKIEAINAEKANYEIQKLFDKQIIESDFLACHFTKHILNIPNNKLESKTVKEHYSEFKKRYLEENSSN